MADTSIEWTDVTWNPIAGCTVLSPGCTNCYAMRMAARLEAMGAAKYRGLTRRSGGRAKWNGIVRTDEAALLAPLRWNKPRMVFVNSMSDLFHAKVPAEFIARVWDVMARASEHTFQILTKRPERMAEIVSKFRVLPNVWLGTSVESAHYLGRLNDLRGASLCSLRLFRAASVVCGSAGPQWNELGYCRRRVRPSGEAHGSRVGRRYPCRLPQTRYRVFLQTVGRPQQESEWSSARRPDVGRIPYCLRPSRNCAILSAGLIAAGDGFDTAKNRLNRETFFGPSNRRGFATAGKTVFKRRSIKASIASTLTLLLTFGLPKSNKPVQTLDSL
jgi:protein gp37